MEDRCKQGKWRVSPATTSWLRAVKREQRRDQLTGLPNALALDEALATHIERASRISLSP
jgi:GGDEF domain-containing protein